MPFAQHKNKSSGYAHARVLRKTGSEIEIKLRRALREQGQSYKIRFRYQYPVGPYICDFVCLAVRLIVEVDGMSHDSKIYQDQKRQQYLEQQGFAILRFSNADVIKDAAAIAVTMYENAMELISSSKVDPSPKTIK